MKEAIRPLEDPSVADLKYEEMRRHEPRSRVGNAVPVSKSKPINRKRAKAARKARKR